ncbi:MAG: ABC transporter ATP-binding protein [Candidatus Promineifilaceae bacterium]
MTLTLDSHPAPDRTVPEAPFVALRNISHVYADDGSHVLQDVSLAMDQGDFVALVGTSGVGKSTLLRILGGLLQPTYGEVLYKGLPPELSDLSIGVVFQHHNLMPWRTTLDNVRLPLELRGQNGLEADQRAREMLDLVGLAGSESSYPAQLSGGMAQRVAIARALVHRPSLLLLDEPFGSLDALTRERMGHELLRIWQKMPVTVFMVTHSISEAVTLSDQVLVIGQPSGPGQPATITERFLVTLPRPRTDKIIGTPAFQACEAAVRAAIRL